MYNLTTLLIKEVLLLDTRIYPSHYLYLFVEWLKGVQSWVILSTNNLNKSSESFLVGKSLSRDGGLSCYPLTSAPSTPIYFTARRQLQTTK